MRYVVYLPLLLPLMAALAARPLAERLPPRAGTLLLTLSAAVLASASTAALGFLAVTGLARIGPLAALVHVSARAVAGADPTALPVAAAAAVVLAGVGAAAVRMLLRRVQTLVMAAKEAACLPGSDELVVVEDSSPEAFAVPGLPGRIVVSTGMLAALEPAERRAVLAHERAHLRCHHYLFIAAAQLAAILNPLLRPVADAVGYTVERWADEDAAATTGDRRLVATAIGKAALAAPASGPDASLPAGAVLGIGGIWRRRPGNPLRGAGPVPRRVAALLRPAPALPLLPVSLVMVWLVAAGWCCLESANDLHALLALAHHSQ